MRPSLQIAVLVLMMCAVEVAQQTPAISCPAISVSGPSGSPDLKKPIPFTAFLSDEAKKFPVTFKWKAYNSEILDGQGTSEVKVSWPDCEKNLTVEVTVTGLPEGCNGTASETTGISRCKPMPILLYEFAKPAATMSKLRSKTIKRVVDENPNVRVFVLIRHRENDSTATIRKRKKEIMEWLAPPDLARYTFSESPGPVNKTQFWLVPAGANIPYTQPDEIKP